MLIININCNSRQQSKLMEQHDLNSMRYSNYTKFSSEQMDSESIEQNLFTLLDGKSQQPLQLEEENQHDKQRRQQEQQIYDKQLNRYRVSKYFKHMKHIHSLTKSLKAIVRHLLQQQKTYINNLQQWQKIRLEIINYLKNNILTENKLQNLFGCIDDNQSQNWNKIKEKAKKQFNILTSLVQNQKYEKLLVQLTQTNIIVLYQIYNDEYKKINMILCIIQFVEQKLLREMLLTEKQLQKQERQEQNKQNQRLQQLRINRKYVYVYDQRTEQTIVAKSEIVDEVEIPTKYYCIQDNQPQGQKPKKYQKLLEVVTSIRKNIFIFIDKLSSYLQYLIRYGLILMELYEEYKYTPKHQKADQKQNVLLSSKQLIKKSKQCLTRISCLMYKMLNPSFQSMSDHDKEIVNELVNLHPQIFSQCFQNSENISDFPYVISFIGFDILWMGKPCLIYLIKDYLIIIEDIYYNKPNISQIKTAKKKSAINKLCIIHLDYTTQIQIYENKLLYHPHMVYISGGQKSNGGYLQFKGKKLNYEEQKKFMDHQEAENNKERNVCSKERIEKWQLSVGKSNMEIFRSIVQLKISYCLFVYNYKTLKIGALHLTPEKMDHSMNFQAQSNTQIKIIKPSPTPEYPQTPQNQVVFPQQKQIPECNKVHVEVLGVEQRQEWLSVVEYQNNSVTGLMKQSKEICGKGLLHEEINYNKISEIVYLQEKQLIELQKYMFQIYQKYMTQLTKLKNANKKQSTYFTIMRLNQYRQNYINNYFQEQQKNEIQCLILMELLNTFLKSKIFKLKPQIILDRLKISEGLWSVLIKQQKQLYGKNSCYKYTKRNRCYQCILESQDSLGIVNSIPRFWKFYQLSLSYPNRQVPPPSAVLLTRIFREKKQPFCHLYAYSLESNYIHSLHRIYGLAITNQEIKENNDGRGQDLCKQIIYHFNKILYVKYLSENSQKVTISNAVQYNLLKSVVRTKRTKKINILIYNLPSLVHYNKEVNSENSPNKKSHEFLLNDEEIGLTIVNPGFFCRTIGNIRKDTTIKHLKFMIGQQLGICNEYIGHFMESFALVLVIKQEIKQDIGWLSSVFYGKGKCKNTQYSIKEVYVLHDFQRVFDLLSSLATIQSKENYFIGIKKLIKVNQPLFIDKIPQNDQNSQLIKGYYQLLQLQLAQIWYKLNQQQIFIQDKQQQFIKIYLSSMLIYLNYKLNANNNSLNDTYLIHEKLLVETGIFTKQLLKCYYLSEGEKKQQTERIKINEQRHLELMNQFRNQLKLQESRYMLLNKILKLVYGKTSWNLEVEKIRIVKIVQKIQQYTNFYILINDTGILLIQNPEKFTKKAKNINPSIISSLKYLNKNQSIILFKYHDIEIEMFGSIITLWKKQKERDRKMGKISFYHQRAYQIYWLIKFYLKWNQVIDRSNTKQGNFKLEMLEISKIRFQKESDRSKELGKKISQSSKQFPSSVIDLEGALMKQYSAPN